MTYAALTAAGLWMTWGMSVFQIIGYASRAFAFYYAVQSLIAARRARGRARLFYSALAGLGVLIAIFGAGVE